MLGGDSIPKINETLLVSDLDGTLLDSKQQISKVNHEAIKEFKENGGLFTIATGRMLQSAMPYIDQLEINVPVILYNGAVIYHPLKDKVLMKMHLPEPKSVLELIENYSSDEEVGILLYQDNEVYAVHRNSLVEAYEDKEKVLCETFRKGILENSTIKILLISNNPTVLQSLEKAIINANFPCEMVYSENNYLEILPMNASKGTALEKLKKYLQPASLNTVCVGDNLNDLSMLQAANTGFFVENSHELLKQESFKGCVHHEEHALADIIKNHLLSSLQM